MIEIPHKKPIYLLVLLCCCLLQYELSSQTNPYDECGSAFFIANANDYCSSIGQFNTNNSTVSSQTRPFCWPDMSVTGDVWISFRPNAPGASVRLIGENESIPSGIDLPSIAVYNGSCGFLEEIACSSVQQGPNVIELSLTSLVIGQIHYIRVDSRLASTGDFQLCIDVFNPVAIPEGDCASSVILCDNSEFVIPSLVGTGREIEDLSMTCIQEEFASSWYTWTCKESGSLFFTLTPTNPNNPEEDLDFAVFLLPDGLENCETKELIRCVASGESIGNTPAQNAPCFGPTGLRPSSNDVNEDPGCENGSDNFAAAIDMVVGQSYALVINNFSRSGFGFGIDFGGTGEFLGPEPGIELELEVNTSVLECDKLVTFVDSSVAFTDPIVEWNWNFGAGSEPNFATGLGPHNVTYESFGDKSAALTVLSTKGCVVTKIIDFFVEPCCQDTSTLGLNLQAVDAICFGDDNGEITVSGFSGSPPYEYSIDGEDFSPSNRFFELEAGTYEVYIQDQKGCQSSRSIVVDQPEELIVNAGPDESVALGEAVNIDATVTPNQGNIEITWTRENGANCEDAFSCLECLDPEIIAPGTSEYRISIVDEMGCMAEDNIVINVSLERPIFTPNIIDLSSVDNAEFIVTTNEAGVRIEDFSVYDRWGNRMFSRQGIPATDNSNFAWNGKFKDTEVNPGVYVWVANILYIDKQTIKHTGSVTVIK